MHLLLQIEGPAVSQTIRLEADAPPVVLGRDPAASVHLPDPERSISRKHVALEMLGQGVRVTVVSSVNGILAPQGELFPGQQTVLTVGEKVLMGPYTLTVLGGPPESAAAPAKEAARDPFESLLGGRAANLPADDPFLAAEFQRPAPGAVSAVDPFSILQSPDSPPPQSFSGLPASRTAVPGFASVSPGAAPDPLAAFVPGSSSNAPIQSIDNFLSPGLPSGPGAGRVSLSRGHGEATPPARPLATDHVHDFNLPLNLNALAPKAAHTPASNGANPGIAPNLEGADVDSGSLFPQAVDQGRSPSLKDGPIHTPLDRTWSAMAAWARGEEPPAQPRPPAAGAGLGVLPAGAPTEPSPPKPDSVRQTQDTASADGAALAAFCRGLGVTPDPDAQAVPWETIGRAVRTIVQGMTELMSARADLKRELRSDSRTLMYSHDNNPLRTGLSVNETVQYLVFHPGSVTAFLPPDVAVAEAVTELKAHEFAAIAASRAAIEGALKEFEPGKLGGALSKGKAKLPGFLNSARLWDSYVTHYEHNSVNMADWLERIFNKYFMPTYSREIERLRSQSQRDARGKRGPPGVG